MLYVEQDLRPVVSTDVAGIQCQFPLSVRRLYQEAGLKNPLLEVVPFPLAYPFIVELSRHPQPALIGGIHGQLGAPPSPKGYEKDFKDWVKVNLADLAIPQLSQFGLRPDIIGCLQKYPVYFNIHVELAKRTLKGFMPYFTFARYSYLAIENGLGATSVQQTYDQVERARAAGADSTIATFDLAHALLGLTHDLSYRSVIASWEKMLDQINPRYVRQLHLPIGLNAADSLPTHQLMVGAPHALKDLGDVIQANGLRIIIENQHGNFGASNFSNEALRLSRIFAVLAHTGVLSTTYYSAAVSQQPNNQQ